MAQVYFSPTPSPTRRRGFPWRTVIIIAVVALVVLLALVILNINAIIAWLEGALNFLFNYDQRVSPDQIVDCRTESACTTIHAFLFSAIVFFIVLTGFAYTTLLERVLIARLQ